MLEDLIRGFLSLQFDNVRHRGKGVALKIAALCMVGVACVFLFIGLFIWLADRIEAWRAAILLAGLALIVAAVLTALSYWLLNRKEPDPTEQALQALETLGLLKQTGSSRAGSAKSEDDTGLAMVAAALATGLILGRSTRR